MLEAEVRARAAGHGGGFRVRRLLDGDEVAVRASVIGSDGRAMFASEAGTRIAAVRDLAALLA